MFNDADATAVWNRAGESLALDPRPGDLALEEMLLFHGLAMNGGVLHACESLGAEGVLDGAQAGYRYFGLGAVADLIDDGTVMPDTAGGDDPWRDDLTTRYRSIVPDDAALWARFEIMFRAHPADFAPV